MALLIFAVMLSNGYNAIDALSAGAVTEKAQAPILLVRKDSIPPNNTALLELLSTIDLTFDGMLSFLTSKIKARFLECK